MTFWLRSRRSSGRSNRARRRVRPTGLLSKLSSVCLPLGVGAEWCSGKRLGTGVESGDSPGMDEDYLVLGRETAGADEVDEAGRCLAGVDRVEDDALGAGEETHGLDHLGSRQSVPRPDIVAESHCGVAR